MAKAISTCPACQSKLHIATLACPDCGMELRNTFDLSPFDMLDDEKSAFWKRSKHRQNGHKKSRYLHCSCNCRYGRVAVIYEEILISMWDGSIISLDKFEFGE